MLDITGINFIAVAVVWLVYMIVGAFWYSPAGFVKKWEKHTGIDIMKIPTHKATKILVAVAISCLIQAFALALILNSLQVTEPIQAVLIALVLWLGMTTATTVGVTLYSQRSWWFLWLNSAYFLVVMVLGALILTI